jgi:uncharacterized protein YraI
MTKFYRKLLISSLLISVGWLIAGFSGVKARNYYYQQPTVSVPTVTGTPTGPIIRVYADQDHINVRAGPSTDYDIVGVMIAGQTAPAYGRTAGGLWIQIGYPGVEGGIAWVYSPLVEVIGSGGDLPIVEPPPIPTPRVTPTIDPTLAAQFVYEPQNTPLPTFTDPPPLVIPTFEPPEQQLGATRFPYGLLIAGFGILGILGALFSLLRGR